jgi:hypothetical protein
MRRGIGSDRLENGEVWAMGMEAEAKQQRLV